MCVCKGGGGFREKNTLSGDEDFVCEQIQAMCVSKIMKIKHALP